MTRYVIGDLHGCRRTLEALLEKINFSGNDELYVLGDLVNRGPDSAGVLGLVQRLDAKVVLGNHDLHWLLAYYSSANHHVSTRKAMQDQIVNASDMEWLGQQCFIRWIPDSQLILTHAGLYPYWDEQAVYEAHDQALTLLRSLVDGNFSMCVDWKKPKVEPSHPLFSWVAFSMMRYCNPQGHLWMNESRRPDEVKDENYSPWFAVPRHAFHNWRVCFGHWASLVGYTPPDNVMALDSACVWGESLSAYDVENRCYYHQACLDEVL